MELEEEKEKKKKQLIISHNSKYKEIKNYYSDIISTNLQKIKDNKEQISQIQDQEEKNKKQLLAAEEKFKALSEPLKKLQQEFVNLK